MSPAKQLFLKNDEMRKQLAGGKKFEEILLTFTDPAYVPPAPLKSGLIHTIDNPQTEKNKRKD